MIPTTASAPDSFTINIPVRDHETGVIIYHLQECFGTKLAYLVRAKELGLSVTCDDREVL